MHRRGEHVEQYTWCTNLKYSYVCWALWLVLKLLCDCHSLQAPNYVIATHGCWAFNCSWCSRCKKIPKQVHTLSSVCKRSKVVLYCSKIFLVCFPWFGVHTRLFNGRPKRLGMSYTTGRGTFQFHCGYQAALCCSNIFPGYVLLYRKYFRLINGRSKLFIMGCRVWRGLYQTVHWVCSRLWGGGG